MNKLNSYIFFSGVALLSLASCKKNNLVVGKDITPAAYVKFSTSGGAGDTVATYYVKSTNQPFKIPVGITNVSDKDRTIQFTYSSKGAVQGVQYNAPASLVIPAGKALDSLTISGLYAGYTSPSRVDTVNITISGNDVPASPYKSHYILYLRGYCDVIAAQLTGDYNNTIDYYNGSASSQGPYTASVVNWVSTGATTATAYIVNLGFTSDNGWGPFYPTDPVSNPGIQATFDWTNAAAFKVTIAKQNYFQIGATTYAPISAAAGSFSSCTNTITIPFTVVYGANSYITTTILKR